MSLSALALTLLLTAQPAKPVVYDPQDPQSLTALLAEMDAKAEVVTKGEDEVLLRVTTPVFGFAARFAGCDRQGRKCQALAFSTQSSGPSPNLIQLNAFNQTSLTCRVWQDKAGKANVMYSALISPRATAEDARTHVGAWQGCLASFGEFVKDPAAYLASAP